MTVNVVLLNPVLSNQFNSIQFNFINPKGNDNLPLMLILFVPVTQSIILHGYTSPPLMVEKALGGVLLKAICVTVNYYSPC
jgi:hypothetical protein